MQKDLVIPRSPGAKHVTVKTGLALLPFVYAVAVDRWGGLLPGWVIVAAGVFVILLFVVSGFLHVREIGFKKNFHDHPVLYVVGLLLCSCLALGTGMYLAMRPAQLKQQANDLHKTDSRTQGFPSPALSSKPEHQRDLPSPKPKHPRPETPTVSPSTVQGTPPAATPNQQHCETGTICNQNSPVQAPQTINNYKDPPPDVLGLTVDPLPAIPPFQLIPNDPHQEQRAVAYNNSLGSERAAKDLTSKPGLRLSFRLSSSVVGPHFRVYCDNECITTSASVTEYEGDSGSSRTIEGLPAVLTPSMWISVTVRSVSISNPITKAKVSFQK